MAVNENVIEANCDFCQDVDTVAKDVQALRARGWSAVEIGELGHEGWRVACPNCVKNIVHGLARADLRAKAVQVAFDYLKEMEWADGS